ncbi:MAG: hypothetical protein ACHQVS_00860 [Candidatus Babeliales bacterium]
MTRQLRIFFVGIMCIGLMTSSIRAGGTEDIMSRSPVIAILVAVCAAMGYYIYGYIKGHDTVSIKLATVEGGVQKVNADLGAFKKETESNFNAVLGGQVALVKGQEGLQEKVAQVDDKVTAAQREIEGLRKLTTEIKTDTTDIKKRAHEIHIKLLEINSRLDIQTGEISSMKTILESVATKYDVEKLQESVDGLKSEVSGMRKVILTQGHMSQIKQVVGQAIDDRIDRARAGYTKQLEDALEPHKTAPRQMLKQTATA